jgi:hypothetical protein
MTMRVGLVPGAKFAGRSIAPGPIGRKMKSRYNPGRVAGLLYLLLGFAVVRLKYIPGALLAGRDAAETTNNIAAHELLFRFGIVSDLITATAAIFVTLALYRLFQGVSQSQAVLLVILGGPMPAAVYFCNSLNDVAALMFALPADFVSALEKPQREAFVMFFLRLHDYGVFANEIFWGLWLFPFGLLVWRSGFIPRILGLCLFVACFGYLAFSFTGLLMPHYLNTVARVANIAILGEAPIILWLAIMGAKPRPLGTAASSPPAG